MPNERLLTKYVKHFRDRHHRPPDEIVVTPLALAALAVKKTVAARWNNVPVRCAEIESAGSGPVRRLGVDVAENGHALVAFDLP